MKLDNFKTFLAEEEKPYKLLILSHDDPLDPNETGPLVRKKAQELGIEVHLAELMGCYMEDDGDDKLVYSYPVDEKGRSQLPDTKSDVEYAKHADKITEAHRSGKIIYDLSGNAR